jgi:hypothetical protein
MIKRLGWLNYAAVVLLLPSFLIASPKPEFFQLENLRPGMKGTGKTCYQGTKPEEFQVEILGVLHGVNPGTSAVLARFSGNLIDKVGIFEGMSGSPVYIDGKLLGAVAFTYSFAKDAIGGITPITQMIDAFDDTNSSSLTVKGILKKSRLWNYRLPLPAVQNGSLQLPSVPGTAGKQPLLSDFNGHTLLPIATPLSMGGFHANALKTFAPQFRAMGLSILQGAGGSKPATASKGSGDTESDLLEPGSNISVSLVEGDLDVSAGGTVTYVDGNRLYAFGHNLFELGFTELPMHKAKAVMVFPSLESSFKILEVGDLAGTIRQDRGMGIYGIVGEKPRMVPMQIQLTTSRGAKKKFNYELARDAFLTPLLVNLTVYNTIIASERAQGAVTLEVKGKIHIKGEQAVEVDNRFSSDSSAPSSASLSIAVPVNYLMAAGYSNLDLQRIDLEISAKESDQSAYLESIRASRSEVRAGESLEIEVSSQQINGKTIQDSYTVKIPENASPGALTMMVADGSTLMTLDEQEEGENLIPRDLTQLIKLINNLRKNDRLYVRFFRREPGAVIKGEGLPGLPPSILAILKSERKVGAINQIRTSTLMEYELPATDFMVVGAKALKLMVKP